MGWRWSNRKVAWDRTVLLKDMSLSDVRHSGEKLEARVEVLAIVVIAVSCQESGQPP